MTDKKTTPESSDKDLTENDQAPKVDETPETTPKQAAPKVKPKVTKPVTKKPTVKPPVEVKKSGNKLAAFALFVALIAIGGVAGVFYWYQQQFIAFTEQANREAQQRHSDGLRQVDAVIAKQQQDIKQQKALIEKQIANAQAGGQSQLEQLARDVDTLKDMRSSDWLLHEAQYLVRLASRAIWLEDDSQGAITLLRDADSRLIELDDPNLLPLREVIHQDIEQLSLLPALESESVILALIGLEKQIDQLPLALAYTPESAQDEPELTLSENTDDWRENLAKSWQRLMEDFITVRRRTASVEPLLSPQQQQNLQQNLSLKLQVAQWSVTRKNSTLFKQSIDDVQTWLDTYYDIESVKVVNFKNRLSSLSEAIIDVPLPTKLRSLKALSQTLDSTPNQAPKRAPLLEKLPMPQPASSDNDAQKEREEGNA